MSNYHIKLSNDFWLDEFLFSETAARLGRLLEPDAVIVGNLTHLCETALQPLRNILNKPIVISSGWRPVWLNDLVHGSKSSQHVAGLAADVRAIGLSPAMLCDAALAANLPFDQVILEFDSWMHISVAAPAFAPRGQVLTARRIGEKVQYLPGLVI